MGRSLQRLLNAYGFSAELFGSAEAFLGRNADSLVGCVVLDIHLSGMSGLELRRRMTASGSILPVIFITANDDDALRTAAIELGCVDCLRKPFPAESLVSAVRKALASHADG